MPAPVLSCLEAFQQFLLQLIFEMFSLFMFIIKSTKLSFGFLRCCRCASVPQPSDQFASSDLPARWMAPVTAGCCASPAAASAERGLGGRAGVRKGGVRHQWTRWSEKSTGWLVMSHSVQQIFPTSQLPIKAGQRCSVVSPPQASTPAATMIRTATLLAILLLLPLLPVHSGEGLAESLSRQLTPHEKLCIWQNVGWKYVISFYFSAHIFQRITVTMSHSVVSNWLCRLPLKLLTRPGKLIGGVQLSKFLFSRSRM